MQSDICMEPLVSIVILYYKRCEIIEQTLRSVLNQDYSNCEIILVDNHSQDGLRDIVNRLGGAIKLIQLKENTGACAGRNAGIRAAQGEYIIFLEDDVCFASSFEASKVVNAFREHPGIHGLAFQIRDPHTGKVRTREWCHTRPYSEYFDKAFETNWFGEGASAFRKEVFQRCGLYYEPLFYGAEGHDMVLRIIDADFRILYMPSIHVIHWASTKGRSLTRQYYYYTRNFIWMAYKDYPLCSGLRFLIPKLLMMAYFALMSRGYKPVLRGAWDGVTGLPAIRRDRRPIRLQTIAYMAEQEKWRPSLVTRLARHRAAPQI